MLYAGRVSKYKGNRFVSEGVVHCNREGKQCLEMVSARRLAGCYRRLVVERKVIGRWRLVRGRIYTFVARMQV